MVAKGPVPGEELVEGVAQGLAGALVHETAGVGLVTMILVHHFSAAAGTVVGAEVCGELEALCETEAVLVGTEGYVCTDAGVIELTVGPVFGKASQGVEVGVLGTAGFTVVEFRLSVGTHNGLTLCILEVDRIDGGCELCGIEHVGVGRAGIFGVLVVLAPRESERRIHTGLEPIVHLGVDIDTAGETVEVGVLEDTVFVEVAERNEIVATVGAAGNGELVLVTESAVVEEVVHPGLVPCSNRISPYTTCGGIDNGFPGVVLVGVVGFATKISAKVSHCGSTCRFAGIAAAVLIVVTDSLVGEGDEIVHVHVVVGRDCPPRPTDGVLEADARTTFSTLLGGDHHNTVCTTGTVKSAGGCILKNGDGLDVLRADTVQSAIVRNAVDHVERGVGGIHGTETADDNACAATRLTGTGSDSDTCHLAVESLGHVGKRPGIELFLVHSGGRSGEGRLLLGAVRYEDGFFELGGLGSELDRDPSPSVNRNLLGGITHAGENQDSV